MALYCDLLHWTVSYFGKSVVLYCFIQYCTTLHCVALLCNALHYIVQFNASIAHRYIPFTLPRLLSHFDRLPRFLGRGTVHQRAYQMHRPMDLPSGWTCVDTVRRRSPMLLLQIPIYTLRSQKRNWHWKRHGREIRNKNKKRKTLTMVETKPYHIKTGFR